MKDKDISSVGGWIGWAMKPNKDYKERRYFSLFLFVCRVRRRGGAGEKKFGSCPFLGV